MSQSGLDAIERAKANGSWERYDMAEDLVVPSELQIFLATDEVFNSSWNGLSDARKRQCLQQIYDAKTESTRKKRIFSIRKNIIADETSL
jgi:uncharacterized protein YdeI (YjbR/CyaY-like superfamily)